MTRIVTHHNGLFQSKGWYPHLSDVLFICEFYAYRLFPLVSVYAF